MLPRGHDGAQTPWASLSELCFLLAQEVAQVKNESVKETPAKRPDALGEGSTSWPVELVIALCPAGCYWNQA